MDSQTVTVWFFNKLFLNQYENGEDGWIPAVRRRRKKSTSESGDSTWKLNVDGGRQVEYKCLKRGILGIYIYNGRNARQRFAVKPSPVSSRTRTKFET